MVKEILISQKQRRFKMKVLILITVVALGNVFTLLSNSNSRQEIGRIEAIQTVNESESTDTTYDKDVYYAQPSIKSNNKGV